MPTPTIDELFANAQLIPPADVPSGRGESHQPDDVRGVGELSDVSDPPAEARLADSETSLVFSPNIDPPLVIVANTSITVFPVKVTKDGGIDGTDTTAATWTYTVKDLDGNTLGAGLEPCNGVRAIGKTKFAPAATFGTAFYDADGTTLRLQQVCEVQDTKVCA